MFKLTMTTNYSSSGPPSRKNKLNLILFLRASFILFGFYTHLVHNDYSYISGACFTKELTITIKVYPAYYSFIKANLKTVLIVLKAFSQIYLS
jgi:hypothetical protein